MQQPAGALFATLSCRSWLHLPSCAANRCTICKKLQEADCIFIYLCSNLVLQFATSCRSSWLPSCAAYLVHHSQQAAEDCKLLKSPQTTVYFMLSFNLHRSIDVDHDQCLSFTDWKTGVLQLCSLASWNHLYARSPQQCRTSHTSVQIKMSSWWVLESLRSKRRPWLHPPTLQENFVR